MRREAFAVLVIGGGPAGIAAARAATRTGARAAIVDDNPTIGGQAWRGAVPDALLSDLPGVRVAMRVVAALGSHDLLAEAEYGPVVLSGDRIILATGARERFLPFPGWTLPGVTGAGGLQALVKGGWPISGRRVVVAGTGPLLLAAAASLRRYGARIGLIAEQAPSDRVRAFAAGLVRHPAKLRQAAELRWALRDIPYRTGCWVRRALGTTEVEAVELNDGRRVSCDHLACGFGLVPNVELPAALGCGLENGAVRVDPWQATSVEGIYAAGEVTGIAGLESALAEGWIAGYAAAGRHNEARALFRARAQARRFAAGLDAAFSLRPELKSLCAPDTVVCRCEDVPWRDLQPHTTWRAAKLHARCGMGPCQGRVCGAAAQFLFGWGPGPEAVQTPARIRTLVQEEVP